MPDMWFDVDTAITECPVNIAPLIDDTDFKTIEGAVAYNAAGMALFWHFWTSAGVYNNGVAVTPTTAGNYDWTDHGTHGIYTIEIPASGGASINNDTEGYGYFTGVATGVLPWRGPTIGFRAAALNDALCDGGDNLDVNTVQWLGTACATPTVAGVPEVDLTHVAGATTNVAALATNVDAILTDTGTTLDARIPAALVGGRMDASVGAMAANVLTAAATAADFGAEVADAVWDEALSGHQTVGTSGRAMLLAGTILAETTAAGVPTTTTVQLTSGSAVDDFYNDLEIIPISGALAGQARVVTDYVGATTTVTVDEAWTSAPVAGVAIMIRARHTHSRTQLAVAARTEMDANSTQLAAIVADTNELQTDWANGGRLDLLIDATKAKTDSLTFTTAGIVDANVQQINDVTITGNGGVGTEFGV